MIQIFLFISLTILSLGSYFVWFNRKNVTAHLVVPFVFLAYFIPIIILHDFNDFNSIIVDLYVKLLTIGSFFFLLGIIIGFRIKVCSVPFSFNIMKIDVYENHIIKITKILLIGGIVGEISGYILMGFVPMFAADPLAAKFFRGSYQVPFYVSIIYLSSFFILSTITPIAIVIWYQRKKIFFLVCAMLAITLMMASLSRNPAFSGVILVAAIILSFKRKRHFVILLIVLFVIYFFSSIFYFVFGIKDYSSLTSFKDDHILWRILSSGTIDVSDQLTFLTYFQQKPEWTYGRTIYGGLIPSHYYWNPSVFTLRVVNEGQELDTLISGGLRLPVPLWGYVSFQWPGVILFCFMSGLFKGAITKYTKFWLLKNNSLITITIIIIIMNTVFEQLTSFYTLSNYFIPPISMLLFYMFRFKLK